MTLLLQPSWLRVVPPDLPPATIALGFLLIATSMIYQYLESLYGYQIDFSPGVALFSALCFSAGIGFSTYVSIMRTDFLLMFVFFLFVSGKLIQGAIAVRFIQIILDFFLSNSTRTGSWFTRLRGYVKEKFRERVILLIAVVLITVHTTASIVTIYLIGSGETVEALNRFWVGFFFLIAIGLVYDFRHFAHRISWMAAFGLLLAVTGAFLYNPVGFSAYTQLLSPYLENPIPEWMRWPLGVVGFVLGAFLWMVFYTRESGPTYHH